MSTNNTRIITKSTKTVRTEYYSGMGGIGNVEFILFGIFITLALTLVFTLPHLYISVPLDFLCLFIFLFLITPNPRGTGKVYNYLINAVLFCLKKKKYFKTEVLHFFPFKTHFQNHLILNNEQKMLVMEISGFDISLLTDEECNVIIHNLSRWWKNIDCKIQLVKVEKNFNLQEQNNYLCELADYWENEYQKRKIDDKTYQNIFEQLNDKRDINFNIENDNDFKRSYFYLTIYANNTRELEQVINHYNLHLTRAKLRVKILDEKETAVMLEHLVLPLSDKESNNTNDLLTKLKAGDINFHKNYWKFNNNFYSITTIKDYPSLVSDGWLIKLANLEQTNMVSNFIDLDKGEALKMLDKAIERVHLNRLDVKKISAGIDLEIYESHFKYLIESLKEENEKLKLTQVYFITHASSLEKLKEINSNLFGVVKECEMSANNLSFQQEIGLYSIFNMLKPKDLKLNSTEMAATTIAAMFPFVDNTLMDSKGLLLGQTAIGAPYYLDMKVRDGKYRNNSNAFIVGASGGGKTYNVSKQLNWLFLNKTRVFIIDPEREFQKGFINIINMMLK